MTWAIFDDSHTRGIIEMISSGSERVLAIVGGALLDETVRRTLKERFRNDPGIVANILEVERPLGNLGAKIDVLYLLHGIDNQIREALKGLAGVRNFFAHNLDASFDSVDKKFLKAMSRLRLHKNRTHYPHHLYGGDGPHLIEPIKNRQTQFVVNLKLGLIMLMRDRVSHRTHTNQPLTDDEIRAQFEKKPAEEKP
jgi:DNA-binding MltR family transcriptional regulator